MKTDWTLSVIDVVGNCIVRFEILREDPFKLLSMLEISCSNKSGTERRRSIIIIICVIGKGRFEFIIQN